MSDWPGVSELVRRDGGTGEGVVHEALTTEATSNEQQSACVVDLETNRHLTGRRVDKQFNGAALQVTPENVTAEEFPCVERGTTAHRDALGRRGTRQHDHIGGRRGHSRCDDPGDRHEARRPQEPKP